MCVISVPEIRRLATFIGAYAYNLENHVGLNSRAIQEDKIITVFPTVSSDIYLC